MMMEMDDIKYKYSSINRNITLVTATNIGIFKAHAIAICSLVINCTPILLPTTSIQKSGIKPVKPNKVVLKYFS